MSKRIVAFLSCFAIALLAIAAPLTTFAQTHASEKQFQYPNNHAMKASKGMVQRIISNMSPEEKIGQLVMPSTHDDENRLPNDQTEKLIKEYKAGSVIVYGYRDAQTTAEYNNQLQKWATETRMNVPLLVSADLEYGAVQHVIGATTFPRQMGIGATRNLDAAKQVAAITAKEARATGFNWNYSPVADVNTNPKNPVIGVRSFSGNTGLVADMTVAQVKGYQENGVLATAKHFPGHGDTSVDSHLGLASVTYDRKTLDEIHLPPFKEAIDAGVDSIMTAHVIIEAIDPELPATLSKQVLTGLLREQLGFDGIIVTDAMSMDAIDEEWGSGPAAVMAVQAGADIVMATGSYEEQIETFDALLKAYESGELSKKRVDQSVERILMKKFKYNLFENRFVDSSEAQKAVDEEDHKRVAEEVAQQSITLVKNEGVLPYDKNADEITLVAGPKIYGQDSYVKDIASAVRQSSKGRTIETLTSFNATSEEIEDVLTLAEQADRIIVPTFSASELPEGQANLVRALERTGKPVAAVSLGLPYDMKDYPDVGAYLASYAVERWGSPVPTSWEAAVDVIFGAQPGGKLPVSIEGYYDYGHGLSY